MDEQRPDQAAQDVPLTPSTEMRKAEELAGIAKRKLTLVGSTAWDVVSPPDETKAPSEAYKAVTFEDVLAKEDAEIRAIFAARESASVAGPGAGTGSEPAPLPRIGLALSGGGIRSAAVSVGLLQALAQRGVLRQLHTISGVSGGGYALGWLTAWTARKDFATVEQALKQPYVVPSGPDAGRFLEPDPLHYLRRYASFLVPRTGLASGDTLAAIAIYLRNLLLIQTMLIAALVALLAALQMLSPSLYWTWAADASVSGWKACLLFVVPALGLACWVALNLLARNVKTAVRAWCALLARIFGFALAFAIWISLPRFVAAHHAPGLVRWMASPAYWQAHAGVSLFANVACWAALLFSISHLIANVVVVLSTDEGEVLKGVNVHARWLFWTLAMTAGSSLLGLFAYGFAQWLEWSRVPGITYAVLGLPAVFLAGALACFFYVGLLGNAFPDGKREWLARLCGYFLFFGAVAGIVLGIALLGPVAMERILHAAHTWKSDLLKLVLPGGWIFTTVAGLLAAHSPSTGKSGSKDSGSSSLEWLASIAPPVFLVGLMMLVSWGTYAVLVNVLGLKDDLAHGVIFTGITPDTAFGKIPWIALGSAIVAVTLAFRLSVNEFSEHLFYRNRLVRAFLGASNTGSDTMARTPDPFTGFALDDDHYLGSLQRSAPAAQKFDGPYPLWCCALNLTSGEDLAWQQRKAASFVYSPLFCGWDLYPQGAMTGPAYRGVAPCDAAGQGNGPGFGGRGGAPLIGTAMAASGAAISPNWGYHTKPAVAALLAAFNVRIGWWTGNPANERTFQRYSPGAYYFLNELFGSAHGDAAYLYLSDGGHFENLGIYELVRRRASCIISSDADADPEYAFGDLANAVERCRVDFGVQIEFVTPFQAIAPTDAMKGYSAANHAIAVIRYPSGPPGTLLYLKNSLTGNEPAQVLGQRAVSASFPHDTTLNQFYNESDFEAYRALGEFIGNDVFQGFDASRQTVCEFLEAKRMPMASPAPAPPVKAARARKAKPSVVAGG